MTTLRAESVLELIGHTPLVRLKSFEAPGGAKLYAKYEAANPGGSVKDRIALNMLEEAEQHGLLKPGATILEPTSGNTGVGLAMVCAVKGWHCLLVMPEGVPERRLAMLKAYGAEIRMTPFEFGMKGALDEVSKLQVAHPDWFSPMQFSNRANPAMHRKTTAQEIYKALKGAPDAFVAGVGTGGTLTGVAEFLKRKRPSLRVVALEPEGAAVLSGSEVGAHRIQGIGAGFVPSVLNMKLVDSVMKVKDEDALATAALLARREGLLVGISSGANVWAAAQVAGSMPKSKTVVTILCDRGETYLGNDGRFE
jgi:cysteine synthase A